MATARLLDPWSPPRPFPVHTWLASRFSFRIPCPLPSTRPLNAEQRRDLELRLLISHLPPWLHPLVLPNLRLDVRRRFPWGRDRCAAGAPLLALRRFPAAALEDGHVGWLRALFISECEIGLTTIQTPLEWLSRPKRNYILALRAARLGQVAKALERCPEAEPLDLEIERALETLRS